MGTVVPTPASASWPRAQQESCPLFCPLEVSSLGPCCQTESLVKDQDSGSLGSQNEAKGKGWGGAGGGREELGVHLTSKSTSCFHAGFLEELFLSPENV